MNAHKELTDMIQVLSAAISIQQKEANFFKFSSEMAESRVTKSLLLEMSNDFTEHVATLEVKKRRLQKILSELRKLNRDVFGIDEHELSDREGKLRCRRSLFITRMFGSSSEGSFKGSGFARLSTEKRSVTVYSDMSAIHLMG